MENQLQALTEKLYQEGVQKARSEAETILAQARHEARQLIQQAQREAQQLISQAEEEADTRRRNVTAELQLATRQATSRLQQEISQLLSNRLLTQPIQEAFNDPSFVRDLMLAAVNSWDPAAHAGANPLLILPEATRGQLADYLTQQLRNQLDAGLELTFDGRLQQGFRLGPQQGHYVVSFTADDFDAFFQSFVQKQTAEWLFGQ